MSRALLWISTLVLAGWIYAQPSPSASVLQRIKTITISEDADSVKLRRLFGLAHEPWIIQHRDSQAFVRHEIAKLQWSLGHGSDGIETDRFALQLRRAYRDKDPENYCRSAFNLALGFRDSNQRDSAIAYFNEVLRISPVNRQKSLSAFNIGDIYKANGEFSLAKRFAHEALRFARSDTLHEQIQSAFILLLDTYSIQLHQGDHSVSDSLLQFIGQPLKYFSSRVDPDPYTIRNHALLYWYESHAHKFRHDYEHALGLIDRAQDLLIRSGLEDRRFQSELYNSKGILLRRLQRYEEALKSLQMALRIRTEEDNQVDMAVTQNNIGDIFLDQRRYPEALQHYHASVDLVSGRTLSEDVTQLPSVEMLAKQGRLLDAFRYVGFKANAWRLLCSEKHEAGSCENALKSYALADSLIDILRAGHLREGSKLFWREDAKRLYTGAIQAALLSGDKAQALYFADRSKAVLVLDAVREHVIRNTSARGLIAQKDSLQEQLRAVESFSKQNDRWLELTAALDKINAQLRKVLPAYTQQSYTFSPGHLQDLIRHLNAEEVIIQYFDPPLSDTTKILDDTLYAFVMTREGIHSYGLNRAAIHEAVRNYLDDIHAFIDKGKASMNQTGPDALYTLLIKPLGRLPQRITIIPDGVIAQIGFEGLRDDEGQFLIESRNIRYDLSLAMAQAMSQKQEDDATRVLALAPIIQARCGQQALPFSAVEINRILATVKCKAMIGHKATKRQFLHAALAYDVLHLATHASANTEEPSESAISLAGDSTECEMLTVQDLYNLHLPASMVVLSACEGARGVYATGEGAMSIARGFAFAGSASVVTSLWQVNDAATAEIMSSFYRHLKAGLAKSDALRQAKLDYLGKDGRKKLELHPAWWSAFVVIGNDRPIVFESPQRFKGHYFIILALLAISVMLSSAWKQRREGNK